MNMESKEVRSKASGKRKSFIRWSTTTFKNSYCGLKYVYTHEYSFWVHLVLTIIVIAMGFIFKISMLNWAFLLILMALIIITELLNTAIEATVDLVTDEWHELAKIAKDTGSAATLVACLLAIGMWAYVFVPKIIELIF